MNIREDDLRAYLRGKGFTDAVFNEIKALGRRDDSGRVRLSKLKSGSRFTYGGIEWVLLRVDYNSVLCIAADIVTERAFDEGGSNNFKASSIREYLNGELIQRMIGAGAEGTAFHNVVMNLETDDGLTDYGYDYTQIGLMSCRMYRTYRKLIPLASDWWWTCTPWTIAPHTVDSYYVRSVNTDGSLGNNFVDCDNWGVRPLCNINSEIFVNALDAL